MQRRHFLRISTAVLVFGFIAARSASAAVLVVSNSLQVTAELVPFQSLPITNTTTVAGSLLPLTGSATVSQGTDSSTTSANLTASLFTYTFTQSTEFPRAGGSATVRFTVDVNTNYAMAGTYSVVGANYFQ